MRDYTEKDNQKVFKNLAKLPLTFGDAKAYLHNNGNNIKHDDCVFESPGLFNLVTICKSNFRKILSSNRECAFIGGNWTCYQHDSNIEESLHISEYEEALEFLIRRAINCSAWHADNDKNAPLPYFIFTDSLEMIKLFNDIRLQYSNHSPFFKTIQDHYLNFVFYQVSIESKSFIDKTCSCPKLDLYGAQHLIADQLRSCGIHPENVNNCLTCGSKIRFNKYIPVVKRYDAGQLAIALASGEDVRL